MNKYEFNIKRKAVSTRLSLLILSLLAYPFIHNQLFGDVSPISDKTSVLLYLLLSAGLTYLFYSFMQFTVKMNEQHIVINNVSTVSYEEIHKAYVGRFDFIESFEERDKLPLSQFKHEALNSFFHAKKEQGFPSGYFLVLHTDNNLFFIKASYFEKREFIKLVLALDDKNIPIEAEKSFLKEKAC